MAYLLKPLSTKSPYFARALSRLPLASLPRTSVKHLATTANLFHSTQADVIMDREQPQKEREASKKASQGEGQHPSSHQQEDSTEGKHEWKTRPPYSIHQDNDKFDVKHEASCHCGKVKYQLSRDIPLDSKLCHCTTCQTQHGTSVLKCFLIVEN